MDPRFRELVRERARERFEYCRFPEDRSVRAFHGDHVLARQHAGDTVIENLAWACSHCNLHKGVEHERYRPCDGAIHAAVSSAIGPVGGSLPLARICAGWPHRNRPRHNQRAGCQRSLVGRREGRLDGGRVRLAAYSRFHSGSAGSATSAGRPGRALAGRRIAYPNASRFRIRFFGARASSILSAAAYALLLSSQ